MKKRSILCLFISVILGVLRVITVRTSVIPENGFYVRGSVMPYVFTTFYIISLVVFAAVSFTFKKTEYNEDISAGIFGAVATLLFAAALVWCGVSALLSSALLIGILALIGGGALVLAAPAHIMKGGSGFLPILLLLPCIWCSVNLMSTFRTYSTIVTVSDYLFDALTLTALLLFMFYSAKSYVYNNGSAMLHFSAYAAFAGVFITALPSAFAEFNGAAVFSVKFTPDLIVVASMLIYIPMTLHTIEKNEIRNTSV